MTARFQVRCSVYRGKIRPTREQAERDRSAIESLGACRLSHEVIEVPKGGRPGSPR